jgi:predicted AAA+ superfamily ATPase
MILKDTLLQVVKSQKKELLPEEKGIEREKLNEIDLSIPYAIIISGIRRCGKSTLLKQLISKTKNFYYFNFEDSRAVSFDVSDFEKLDAIFKAEYGNSDYYFFDEIQNVAYWERFVRTLLDRKKKVIITGSNASLLSKELGTRLTGRHLRYELFPFSYREMLFFNGKKHSLDTFREYMEKGGFPEYLKYKKPEILRELFKDIISRDIIVRHKLRHEKVVKEIAAYFLTNIGKEFSYNNLAKTFELGSPNSLISFVSYFEDSYLIFTINRFDYSLKKQQVSQKKAYCIDPGFLKANSLSFSSDYGRILENIVFLNLRRKNNQLFYFKKKYECDFLVKEKEKITGAYQVCYKMDSDNKDREINGLVEAMDELKLKNGFILTYDQEDLIKIDGKKIIIKPVWKWLLED